jgi:hypothetical protein
MTRSRPGTDKTEAKWRWSGGRPPKPGEYLARVRSVFGRKYDMAICGWDGESWDDMWPEEREWMEIPK